jgi:hypothetical protein
MPKVFHLGYCDDRFPGKTEEEQHDHTYQEIPLWFLD